MNQTIPPFDAYRGDQPQAVVYTREQKGHSLILHLTLGALVLWIPAIYISISPRHFWHI